MDKEKVQAVLDASPADFDVDQFLEKVCLLEAIERGERYVAEARVIDHNTVKDRLKRWLA